MSEHRYTVLFEPAEEGGYVVTCPALPGLVTKVAPWKRLGKWLVARSGAIWRVWRKNGLSAPADIPLAEEPVKEEIEIAVPDPA
ncbi:MAG TPA: type II toxin-antitoxin system HicB family antitoxin [Bryobacteraceae bacterium]|jgi:hypothetical protein